MRDPTVWHRIARRSRVPTGVAVPAVDGARGARGSIPGMQTTRRAIAAAVLAYLAVLATSSLVRAGDDVVFTFTTGTADVPGKITVTNANTGSTTSVGLLPKISAAACASMLSDAAPKVGFKAELDGASVTIRGHGVVVKVEGASITRSDK
jgi:hypothetical protein